MPLSPPAERQLEHRRAITIDGYLRKDGLYDIEAELSDIKTYSFPSLHRKHVAPGEKVHHMFLRVTITQDLEIVSCEAAMDQHPYSSCFLAEPNFARLTGLRIGKGFLATAASRVGGNLGCTHLRELLRQVATTAFQTVHPTRVRLEFEQQGKPLPEGDGYDAAITRYFGGAKAVLNSCMAYAEDSPLVKHRWPEHYTGKD